MYTVDIIRFQSGAIRHRKQFANRAAAFDHAQNALFALGFERMHGRNRVTVRVSHNGAVIFARREAFKA